MWGVIAMREIKFRGRGAYQANPKHPVWYYGDLLHKNDGRVGIRTRDSEFSRFYVDPATVGQFTGIKDISGAEIYEGDIITFKDCETDEYVPGAVEQSVEGTWWVGCAEFRVPLWNVRKTALILSNIYESPELLEADHARN